MTASVRFKVDEDLPTEVAQLLRTAGHDARSVLEQQMVGWTDDRLWGAIVAEGRSLITADAGFADARRLVDTTGIGVVLIRAGRESRQAYIQLTQSLLASYDLRQVGGCVVTVTPEAIRVHDTQK